MTIALSPCPNDTYLFHGWLLGQVAPPPSFLFADIEQLNQRALTYQHPLIKVSCALLPQLLDTYALLPVGAALGFDCGPKLIAREPFPLEELSTKHLAIPGEHTTAHLLAKHLLPPSRAKHFCLFHEISSLLRAGHVDAGVIIHESRFTYADEGFVEIADLGTLWHQKMQLPLPLGCLVAYRSQAEQYTRLLSASLAYADAHPEASRDFVQQHAQIKDPAIIAKHIALYVNDDTARLSQQGLQALISLLGASEKVATTLQRDWNATTHLCHSRRSTCHT